MTIIFQNGFEEGDFSAWTNTITSGGSSASVENLHPFQGTYNEKHVILNGGYSVANKGGLVIGNIGHARQYIQVTAVPNANGELLYLISLGDNAMTNFARALMKHDGANNRWALMTSIAGVETTTYEVGASNPVPNTWYCLEVMYDVTNDIANFWVDAALKATNTGLFTAPATKVWSASPTNTCGETVTLYGDNVVVADDYIGLWNNMTGVLSGVGAWHH